MTNEEIEAVAYKDFLEIRGRVEIAKDKFVQRVRCTPPGFWALHSLQETHTLQTRSKNTWTVYFYYLYTTPAGAVKVSSMIYTSLPGDEGTDYLFMNNLDRFRLERIDFFHAAFLLFWIIDQRATLHRAARMIFSTSYFSSRFVLSLFVNQPL